MFDHYVFETGADPVPYLPRERRGMLGDMSTELQAHVRSQLIRSLTKPMPPQLRGQILRLLWGTRQVTPPQGFESLAWVGTGLPGKATSAVAVSATV